MLTKHEHQTMMRRLKEKQRMEYERRQNKGRNIVGYTNEDIMSYLTTQNGEENDERE